MASLFVGYAAQKSKLNNLQYDEGGNHMAETETGILMEELPPERWQVQCTYMYMYMCCIADLYVV